MRVIDLVATAAELPQVWTSDQVARVGTGEIRVLRMDGAELPWEVHEMDEALMVVTGRLNLELAGLEVPVGAGRLMVVPAGTDHRVAAGSWGTLVLLPAAPVTMAPDPGRTTETP
ncbi:cupin domain-containing protein [Kitasatospora acidiphila]|uniref:Cupin domain-containing protein n=1 Tax=Kitasatospora acidiphila TaxID=2567942 RepID=A0A540WC78_9ACTN|nr:cupin domain-containing protein [Kitasatospora acidiphila]TQF06649.1 cupin domain-containing protein [Kitasatospora acidiphila]